MQFLRFRKVLVSDSITIRRLLLLEFMCFGVNQKRPKTSTSTYRTKISLCQLNSMAEPLQFGYKLGTLQVLEKTRLS